MAELADSGQLLHHGQVVFDPATAACITCVMLAVLEQLL